MTVFYAICRELKGEVPIHYCNEDRYLAVLTGDSFSCEIDGEKYLLPNGSFFYLLPQQTLTLCSTTPDAVISLIEFSLEPEEDALFHSLPLPITPIQPPNPEELISVFRNIFFLFYAADRYRAEKQWHFMCLLLYATASGDEELLPGASKEEQRIHRLRQLRVAISNNPNDFPTIQSGAKYVGLGVARFQALYQQQFHVTYGNDLIHFRIKRACSLLKNTDWTVSRIAHAVGYADENYFYRQFRKQLNMTPREYRRAELTILF